MSDINTALRSILNETSGQARAMERALTQEKGTGAGTGTVTSVALTVPSILSVAGSPIVGAGTLAVTLATQSANQLWAGPTSGGAAAPTFRAMVSDDIPATIVTYAKIQNVTTARLLGRTTVGAGVVEEISVGSGLTLTGGVLDTAAAAGSVVTKTADYVTLSTDGTVLVSASTVDITIDLLSPAAYSGKIVYYKKIDTSAYYVRLVARAGTVEASHVLSLPPNANYAAVGLQSDGTQWWVISAVGSYTLTPASGALWALNWFGQGSGWAGAGANRQRRFGRGKQYLFGQSFGGR